MSHRFVIQRIEELLADSDFKWQNRIHNPNDPETAIAVALRHLAAQYSRKTDTARERIDTLWQQALNDRATSR